MSPKRATRFYRVGDIIALFVQMGCEIRVVEETVYEDNGDCFNVRYLIEPETKRFVPLVDLADDHFVPEDEVKFWERRLGIVVPKGD